MKKPVYGLFLAVSLLTINGCADGGQDLDGSSEEDNAPETETETSGFPVEMTDAAGETLTIEEKPERIVSIIPSNTEIAFALGLEEEIVGVSDHANYPEEAMDKERVGGMDFNVEKIISLEPDLLLAHASALQQAEEGLEQIEEAGVHVLVVNEAASFEGAYESIEMIGKAAGAEEEASNMVTEMKKQVQDLEEQAAEINEEERKTVWMEIQPPPEIFTTGQGTFQHEMLEIINADNAAGDEEGWLPYSAEEAVSLNPDVIITTYGSYAEGDPEEEIKSRSGWSNIPAVESGEIYDVNSDLVSRPGPRLTEGAEELAELVYPDVFTE
ncbi:ABC transporter substrate-binding protein [Salibacterium aidingense]|uniref:ABC transporter substrate-binding protein n=1 Tax=Salibacterium aidingense TaxID=384933 RepID=UPI003BD69A63